MRRSVKLGLATAVVPLALLGGSRPAAAHTVAAGQIDGDGTISPPLTVTGTGGSGYSFNGWVTGSLPALVRAHGLDSIGSIALGEGSVNLTAPFFADGAFVRAGAVLIVVVADSAGPGAGAGIFAFLPDPINTAGVDTYALAGVGGGVDL